MATGKGLCGKEKYEIHFCQYWEADIYSGLLNHFNMERLLSDTENLQEDFIVKRVDVLQSIIVSPQEFMSETQAVNAVRTVMMMILWIS